VLLFILGVGRDIPPASSTNALLYKGANFMSDVNRVPATSEEITGLNCL